MNVLTYLHIRRTLGQTTGVARHAIQMIRGLVDRHAFNVHLLGARSELLEQRERFPGWALADRPAHPFRASRALMERWWYVARTPPAERYWPEAQWVYVPNEAYVPVRRAKLAFTIHDLDYVEPDLPWSHLPEVRRARRAWLAKLRPMCRRADVVLAVSAFTRQRIVELLGVAPEKVAVVGNGVDDRFFALADLPAAPTDRPYLLQVGAMIDKKGARAVLALARELAARKSPVEIRISGKIEEKFQSAVAALPNIRPLGYVPDDALTGALRGAVALILLSRYEGFGMPPLEAMAAGVPAVVSHHASLPEVVGDAAAVVDPEAPESVAEAVDRLLGDPAHRAAMIARGRARAEGFRWSACVDRLAGVLRGEPGRPGRQNQT